MPGEMRSWVCVGKKLITGSIDSRATLTLAVLQVISDTHGSHGDTYVLTRITLKRILMSAFHRTYACIHTTRN